MPTLNLKPTHKAVKDYYGALEQFDRLGVVHETAVRSPFQSLLDSCARRMKLNLVPEHSIALPNGKRIVVDGALKRDYNLVHGYWEAKDIHDDLEAEVKRKFQAGYPSDNIIFQTPERAILWQNGSQVLDVDITDKARLIDILQAFLGYLPQEIAKWEEAVAEFKDVVPDIGRRLSEVIHKQRLSHSQFAKAFNQFYEKCRSTINPNLSEAAVEEMLIQHLTSM